MTAPLDCTPLHSQSPTTRFSDRASDYVRFRPTYPPAAIDAVLQGLGDPATLVLADVGAGTGISSRLLAERGARVLAIEPNLAMAEAAEPHAGVRFVTGTAEATTLEDAAVHAVMCAQAFHWFRPIEALREFRRILKVAGRLALVWNIRDDSDPLTNGYTAAIRRAIGSEPAEMRSVDESMLVPNGFAAAQVLSFEHSQELDLAGLLGRAASASYVPKSGPAHGSLVLELTHLHAQHANANGLATMRYQTRVYRSARA